MAKQLYLLGTSNFFLGKGEVSDNWILKGLWRAWLSEYLNQKENSVVFVEGMDHEVSLVENRRCSSLFVVLIFLYNLNRCFPD